MLKRNLAPAAANDSAAERTMDLRCSALIGRTIFQASATLAQMSREPALLALEGEAEHLTVMDFAAAERALGSLLLLQGVLEGALADARMSRIVGAALVRAADTLPGDSEPSA
ncbi:MAG TPA: hypothetical protein VHW60_16625 [Caulobacteraceae bacterium]|jgi:hypothetical protein|nr:hypothetical protein [Caulobacteraceae bacterium]